MKILERSDFPLCCICSCRYVAMMSLCQDVHTANITTQHFSCAVFDIQKQNNCSGWQWTNELPKTYTCQARKHLRDESRDIGSLHDPGTGTKSLWHMLGRKLHSGKATRTNPPWPAVVLEVPLCNLCVPACMCDFVSCDQIVQRAYWVWFGAGLIGYEDRSNEHPFGCLLELFSTLLIALLGFQKSI